MGYFYDKFNEHLHSLDPVISFSRALGLADIRTSQEYYWKNSHIFNADGKRKGRIPSVPEVEALINTKELQLDRDTAMGWRAIDEFGPGAIQKAYEGLYEEGLISTVEKKAIKHKTAK